MWKVFDESKYLTGKQLIKEIKEYARGKVPSMKKKSKKNWQI